MRTIAAFLLGVLACFIVMRSITHEHAEKVVTQVSNESHSSDSNSSPSTNTLAPSPAETSANNLSGDGTHALGRPLAKTARETPSNADRPAHQRPASELIEEMISSAGDPVMGNPLLAPHQQLQAEAKDDPWSTQATGAMRDNLRASVGTSFEFPSIDCGTDICEIQAATINPVSGFNSEEFQNVLHTMGEEPWWINMQLGHPSCTYSGSKNGRALIVCFLARNG